MMKFLNTKAKAFVVFIFLIIYLGIFIFSSLFATLICQDMYVILIGLGMMILAIPFHCKGRAKRCKEKNKLWCYFVSIIFNSVATGFIVSAYYITSKITIDIFSLFIGAIPAVAIIFLVYLMLQTFNKTKKVTIIVASIINLALTIFATVLWIMDGDVIYSFGFFCSLISFFYLCVFGITINYDDRSVFRDISFGSFGSFIIIAVVVITIISEGEVLDGLDVGGGIGEKKTKKPKHKA